MASNKIYETITNLVIEKLENGVIPWHQGWQNGGAVNWKTQKAYRGINSMILPDGEYATFKQIKEAGGKVKKGSKSFPIVFWKWTEYEDTETGETEKIPFMKQFNVFEINTQVEGLESKREETVFEHTPMERCEKVWKDYKKNAGPLFTWLRDGAWYKRDFDQVNVPPMKDFKVIEEFYSTLFHEIIHSTGHKDRLNREGIEAFSGFGSKSYSKEELVAEMGAAMLCGHVGIENKTIDNSAAYIDSWLQRLKNDKKLIITAAGQAQRAADHVLGIKFEG